MISKSRRNAMILKNHETQSGLLKTLIIVQGISHSFGVSYFS